MAAGMATMATVSTSMGSTPTEEYDDNKALQKMSYIKLSDCKDIREFVGNKEVFAVTIKGACGE